MGLYVDAGDLRTYYEVHGAEVHGAGVQGAGEPLVLLHGGLATAESWALQIPALARRYTVYVPERRGHGRTPDVAGPISYALMAADTIAFLDTVGLSQAHLVGWSDGGAVAALVAIERPDLARKLVIIGQYLQLDGERPESRATLDTLAQDAAAQQMFRLLYDQVSPDGPEHFPIVFDKIVRMWRREPEIALSDLARLAAPTLLLQGDDDAVRVEHNALLARTIPDAQLAVVPGTSHGLPLEKPDLVNQLILDFLADKQVARLFPLTP